jgi:hypothetical protein
MKSGRPSSSASAWNRGSSKWPSTLRHSRCVPRIAGVSVCRLRRRDRFLQVATRAGLRNSRNRHRCSKSVRGPTVMARSPLHILTEPATCIASVYTTAYYEMPDAPMQMDSMANFSTMWTNGNTRIIKTTTLYAADILMRFSTAATLQAHAPGQPVAGWCDLTRQSRTKHPARSVSAAAVVR